MGTRVNEALEGRIAALLDGELHAAQDAIRGSVANLPPLAEHVRKSYSQAVHDDVARKAAFRDAKVGGSTCRLVALTRCRCTACRRWPVWRTRSSSSPRTSWYVRGLS